MARRIGFVSTRFAGVDGVSLEASKWAAVLEAAGHRCFWFAGELERPAPRSMRVARAHFKHLANRVIDRAAFGPGPHGGRLDRLILAMARRLEADLYRFVNLFDLDLLIAENCLSIPMQLPLGVALTRLAADTGIEIIAHHHDLRWERTRFALNGVSDMMLASFPPVLPNIHHVAISSIAAEEFRRYTGQPAAVIPNVMDFEHPPGSSRNAGAAFRRAVGAGPRDILILQPTRVVSRKGIEHAIELAARLDLPRCKLVVSHESGDEGDDYARRVQSLADRRGGGPCLFQRPAARPAGPLRGRKPAEPGERLPGGRLRHLSQPVRGVRQRPARSGLFRHTAAGQPLSGLRPGYRSAGPRSGHDGRPHHRCGGRSRPFSAPG